jgi:L-ascorbate metabolism protein UlaG (beta-lactamase superfamily)
MSEPIYQLAPSVYVEPLVSSWSAWWLVFSPVPASLHLLNYQLPVLRSYLASPASHYAAANDPMFKGGSFINVPPEHAAQIAALLERTDELETDRLELARAFTEFQSVLLAKASGQSLDRFYPMLPVPLRGITELLYDYHNRPLVRVVEPLAYRTRYHKRSLQSLRLAALHSDHDRPFWMSTPRLPHVGQIDWQVPFDDERVDRLFRLDTTPAPLRDIENLLGPASASTAATLLTSDVRPLPARWEGTGVRVRYVGHACVLLEAGGVSVLTDPFVGVQATSMRDDRLTFADLPERIDFALITHAHPDHFNFETLLRLRHRIQCLVVPRNFGIATGDISLKLMAEQLGFKDVRELDVFDRIRFDGKQDGEIAAVPFQGEHGDLTHGNKTGYLVRFGAARVLLLADSACHDVAQYKHVTTEFGNIDSIFIATSSESFPMAYSVGSVLPATKGKKIDTSRVTRGANATETLGLLEAIRPNRLFTYGMGMESYSEYILGVPPPLDSQAMQESERFLTSVRAMGISAKLLRGSHSFALDA